MEKATTMNIYKFGLMVIGLILGSAWVMIILIDPGLGVLSIVSVIILAIILAPDRVGRLNWRK